MALDFRNMKKLTIGGIELKKLLINGIEVWKSFTNMIPLSINADGTPYRGTNGEIGYKTGIRLSGGAETSSLTTDAVGFIPAGVNDKFYFSKGLMVPDTNNRVAMVLYDANFQHLDTRSVSNLFAKKDSSILIGYGLSFYDDDTLYTVTAKCLSYWAGSATVNKTAYVRFVTYPITGASCITKNEPL
jgi:hypothetical protein